MWTDLELVRGWADIRTRLSLKKFCRRTKPILGKTKTEKQATKSPLTGRE